jgi:hypothetical protein
MRPWPASGSDRERNSEALSSRETLFEMRILARISQDFSGEIDFEKK